ncbi:hypothetical protein [Candidatus Thiosymbion oneisti]|uniref:hypothetical protein n=1 Tax=Candidatus Thiosymbion oneisti TaxID=589554 RepID=UPI00105E9149|nr:hypothetical protein [Candidatus Thiosymbion oneisti]
MTKTAQDVVQHELETAMAQFAAPTREAQRIAIMNLIAAGMTLGRAQSFTPVSKLPLAI